MRVRRFDACQENPRTPLAEPSIASRPRWVSSSSGACSLSQKNGAAAMHSSRLAVLRYSYGPKVSATRFSPPPIVAAMRGVRSPAASRATATRTVW